MKLILVIFLLYGHQIYGQRHKLIINELLTKGDSLEILYEDNNQLKNKPDTLPLYTDDENHGWMKMKLVTYFYDSQNGLKKIYLVSVEDGECYFYFDGNLLRKVRVIDREGLINLQYYFTAEDNQLTESDIERLEAIEKGWKRQFELLKTSKSLFIRFKSLL